MSDLISRQAVLDGIAEWIVSGYADSEADCSHISSLVTHLPSVENKGDLISRQAVMECFKKWQPYMATRLYEFEKELTAIPSVENKGEWIEKAEDYYKAINEYGGGVDENTDYFTDDIACPKCLSKFSTIDNETERFNFCPNCGCQMNKENNNVNE